MKYDFKSGVRDRAWQLAIAASALFAMLAAGAFFLGNANPLFGVLIDALRAYGAVILSFLGGIRWGMALQGPRQTGRTLAYSVASPFAAWLAFFLTPVTGIILLLVAFSGQGAWDSLSLHNEKELAWFARLRVAMTCIVVASLLVALLALSRTG
jgi:hypothetical protein